MKVRSVLRGLAIAVMVFPFEGCESRKKIVSKNQQVINANISIGDDIFLARDKLAEMGFRIKSGPNFATQAQDYYLMIVDCGVPPSSVETFRYTVGIESNGELIDVVIRSGIDKKITSIQ